MADKDTKTTEVAEQKLDDGYSNPTDTRTDPNDTVKLNTPGGDFSHLKEQGADRDDMPLDNTPAGKAMNNDDGRPMTQDEKAERDEAAK